MANYNPNSFKYVLQDESVSKVCREVHVSFKLGKNTYRTFVFIPKKEDQVSKSYYIDEAKKEIDRQIKSGELVKNAKLLDKKHPYLLRGVLITTACVAMVAGAAGLTWHFMQKEPAPIPQTTCEVSYNFGKFGESEKKKINSYGANIAEIGKEYVSYLYLEESIRNTHSLVLFVTMNDKDIEKDAEGGYKLEPISKIPDINVPGYKFTVPNVTGNIRISGYTEDNSYYVNFTKLGGVDCFDSKGQPAPEYVARNGGYSCFVKVNDETKYKPNILGITMAGYPLVVDTDYNFNEETGYLEITKPATGAISIVVEAKEKDPTSFLLYYTSYGVTAPTSVIEVPISDDYVCSTIKATADTDNPHVVSVTCNNIELTKETDYTFEKTNDTYTLTIKKHAIKGEIHITLIAIAKPQTTTNVIFDGGTTCNFEGSKQATLTQPYTCKITPKTAGDIVNIVSVVMDGESLAAGTGYTYNSETGEFKITEVTGDIYISAFAKTPESTDHAVAFVFGDGVTTDGSSSVEHLDEYSCHIEADSTHSETHWVRIVSVTMGGVKLSEGAGYTYDRSGNNNYVFTIVPKVTGDIIVAAILEEKTKSTFMMEKYIWDCTKTAGGADTFTPGLGQDYTMTIKPNDLEYKTPDVVAISVAGTPLTPGADTYSLAETATGSNIWVLTIKKEVVTSDTIIAIGVKNRDRANFHVDTFLYGCTSTGSNSVGRNEHYKAHITAVDSSSFEPKAFKVIMGSTVLTEGSDYKLDLKASSPNFEISVPATDDITICVTSKPKAQHLAVATFETLEGGVTAKAVDLELAAGDTLADVNEVRIDPIVEQASSNATLVVTEIKAGILSGCSNIEKLSIPFIGTKLTYNKTDKDEQYGALFGSIFGGKLFEGCTSLTWQDFYADVNETTDSYRIQKAAIPSSLTSVTITGQSQIPQGAFSQCRHINKIVFENYNTDTVGAYAFNGCSSLKNVHLVSKAVGEAHIEKIEWRAFENCTTLNTFDLTGVTEINHHAFANCTGISSINIPSSTVNIGSGAFTNISTAIVETEFTRSEVRAKVGHGWAEDWIDSSASIVYGFYDENVFTAGPDDNYRFIRVKIDNGSATPAYGACITEYLGDDKSTGAISLPATLKGPAIDSNADYNYPVVEIGAQVFYGYTRLPEIIFPLENNQYTVIENFCFTSCTSLAKLTNIDKTQIKILGEYAFDRCNLSTAFTLPNSVEEIGKYCFAYISGNAALNISNVAERDISERLFYNSKFSAITLPSGITSIGDSAFEGCTGITSLTINHSSADTISGSMCAGCTSLTSFTWSKNATTNPSLANISAYAFSGCSNLTSVTFDGNNANTLPITTGFIGDYAFADCTKISAFYIPYSAQGVVINMGAFVFNNWAENQILYIASQWVTGGGWFSTQATTAWGWYMSRAFGDIDGSFHCNMASGTGGLIITKY